MSPDLHLYAFSAYAVPTLLTALAALGLGLGVTARERASPESLLLLGLCACVALWLGGFSLMYLAATPTAALFWARAAYLAIPLIPAAIYSFAVHVLRVHERRRRAERAAWLLCAASVPWIVLGDQVIVGLYRYPWGYYPRFGPAAAVFLVGFALVMLMTQAEFAGRLRVVARGRERSRLRWLVASFAVAYLAMVDFAPAMGVAVYPIGYAAVLTFLAMAAWTIRRYRLLDLTVSFAAPEILDTMADALVVADARGRIHVANRAAGDLLDRDPRELVRTPLDALIVDGSERAPTLRDLLASGARQEWETRLVGAGGQPIDVSVSSSRLTDEEGDGVGLVLIARDIRERKAAERLLREREDRFRSLVENISDAIVVIDAEARVRFATSSLTRIIGYTPEERLGRVLLDIVHPDDAVTVRETLRRGLEVPGFTHVMEARVRHRDGSWRTVEATATNLLDHPAVAGIIVAYHDITERKRAEEALKASQEQLLQSQKMEAIGRLAGGVAHDFNNLLTVINGHAGMILGEPWDDAEIRASVEEILEAGRRASDLTRQLLAFSRKQVLQPRVVDLDAVVVGLERMLGRMIGEDVDLVVDRSPEPVYVSADPSQLEQVLVNLAVNARDAMPDGGRLRFAVRSALLDGDAVRALSPMPPGRYVELTVSDSGCGMEEATRRRIFEPFFTTKPPGKGTGLGLSTVYGIVKQSGGYVWAESAVGRGTTFRVYFPPERWAAPVGGEPPAEGGVHRGSGTVLVVEDDPHVRALTHQILLKCGYAVIGAGSGTEALRLAAAHDGPLDLLLTDVVMPGMSGRELAQQAAALCPGVNVLFMSGYTDDAIAPHGVLRDPHHFIEKPFTPSALAAKVRAVLSAGPAAPR